MCQLCDRHGHYVRICRSHSHNHIQAHATFDGQQMQQSSPWIVDSGVSHHVTSDAQVSTMLLTTMVQWKSLWETVTPYQFITQLTLIYQHLILALTCPKSLAPLLFLVT